MDWEGAGGAVKEEGGAYKWPAVLFLFFFIKVMNNVRRKYHFY